MTNCLGPEKSSADNLAIVEENEEAQDENGVMDESLSNPTPMMKEMMKKRRSVAPKTPVVKSPAKAKANSRSKAKQNVNETVAQPSAITRPASPPPRPDFPGTGGSKVEFVNK